MAKPKVSIIIPCYQVSSYVRQAVLSVLRQSYPVAEVIVVSDGCYEKPEDKISDLMLLDNRLTFSYKENGGVASARNFGLAGISKDSKYVMFLDGDDCLKGEAIIEMVNILEASPDAGMVHCEPEFIDEAGYIIINRNWLPRYAWKNSQVVELTTKDKETPFESVYSLAGIIPSLTLYRRKILDQTTGYDEEFGQHFEDTDLNLQIAIRSRVAYLPEKLMQYRFRTGQSSSDTSRHASQLAKLRMKWQQMSGLSEVQRTQVQFAKWFNDYPLAAKSGWKACKHALKDRRWFNSLQFAQGALRKEMLGTFNKPRS